MKHVRSGLILLLLAGSILVGLLPGCHSLPVDMALYAAFPPRIAIIDVQTGETSVLGKSSEHVVSVSESSKTFCTIQPASSPQGRVIVRTYGFDGARRSKSKYPRSSGVGLGESANALSPDGTILACAERGATSDGSFSLLNLETGTSKPMLPGLLPAGDEARPARRQGSLFLKIEWLSDTQLALMIPPEAKLHPNTVALVDLPEGNARVVYQCPEGWFFLDSYVSFSPDHRYVTFVETIDEGPNPRPREMKVLNLETGDMLSFGKGTDATFSPDNRRVAFIDARREEGRWLSELKVADPRTGSAIAVVEGHGGIMRFCWSPDSGRIALLSYSGCLSSYSLRDETSAEIKDFYPEPLTPSRRSLWFSGDQRILCELESRTRETESGTKIAAVDITSGEVSILAKHSLWPPVPIDDGSKVLCTINARLARLMK